MRHKTSVALAISDAILVICCRCLRLTPLFWYGAVAPSRVLAKKRRQSVRLYGALIGTYDDHNTRYGQRKHDTNHQLRQK